MACFQKAQQTSLPDLGRLGSTPSRMGRLGSYTNGSVLRFTISCVPKCTVGPEHVGVQCFFCARKNTATPDKTLNPA